MLNSRKRSTGRKRYWPPVIAAVLASATLAACSGGSSGGSANGHESITLWEQDGPLYKTAVAPVLKSFEKAHPNVTIDVQTIPNGNYQQDVLTGAAAGNLPCILYANSQDSAAILQANIMTPIPASVITKSQLATYPTAFLEGLENSAGALQFVPDLGGIDQLYIRTNTPAGDAQPRTYAQWISFGKQASTYSTSGKLLVPGIGWGFNWDSAGNYQWLATMFLGMVEAAGGQDLNNGNRPSATKALFDSQAGLDALQFMHDTIWKYHIALPPSGEPGTSTDPLQGFEAGKENSISAGSFMGNALASLRSGPYSKVTQSWDATNLMPQPDQDGKNVVVVDNDGYGVTKSCPDQSMAWQFLKSYTSFSGYLDFTKTFLLPVTGQNVMSSPQGKSLFASVYPSAKHIAALWTTSSLRSESAVGIDTVANQQIYEDIDNNLVTAMNNPDANLSKTLASMASQVSSDLASEG